MSSYQPTIRTLCRDFMDQAVHTWKTIEIGKITNIDPSEETLTENNLRDLQIKHPYEIKTQKYSKRKEAILGADWDWWLGSQGSWLSLRVQAKKLDSAVLNYPYMDHVVNGKRQVDLLIKTSLNENPPRFPVYVFYNYWDVNQCDPPWICLSFPKMVETLGCTFVHAFSVKSLLNRGSKRLKDIAYMMYPWSCLVCCHGYARAGGISEKLPYRAFEFLNKAFRDKDLLGKQEGEDSVPFYERDRFVSEKPPSYVTKIADGVPLSEEEWSDIKVNKVTVIRELDDKSCPPDSTH